MAGENCLLFVKDYGSKRVVATRVAHGLEIVTSSNEDQSRAAKQFHTAKVAYGSFYLTLNFRNYATREDFNQWFELYVRRLADPSRNPTPMRVTIPAVNFEKWGIPEGGIQYGESVGDITYSHTFAFTTVKDAIDIGNLHDASSFESPTYDDPALVYLYPAGEQLSGINTGEDFDDYGETASINEVETLVTPRGDRGNLRRGPR